MFALELGKTMSHVDNVQPFSFFPFIILFKGCLVLSDWWLLKLTNPSHDPQHQTSNFFIYGGLVIGAFLLTIARAVLCLNAFINSSKNLHNSMLAAVLKAPVSFLRHQSSWTSVEQIFSRYWHHGRTVARCIPRSSSVRVVFHRISCSSVCFELLGNLASHPAHGHFYLNCEVLPQVIA